MPRRASFGWPVPTPWFAGLLALTGLGMFAWPGHSWSAFWVTNAVLLAVFVADGIACTSPRAVTVTREVAQSIRVGDTAPLAWVVPVGEQDVDYDYREGAAWPSTADIAAHFPPLTPAQAARVLAYCEHGLPDTYRAMELPSDSYFEKPRVWRLSVFDLFDHAGGATHFHYRVEGDRIERLAGCVAPLSWTTEIAAAKLYAGLELGESLTSMYMRINEAPFDAATEADLADADIVDDPLIRCMFDDAFGAYQAAQLRRIQARNEK